MQSPGNVAIVLGVAAAVTVLPGDFGLPQAADGILDRPSPPGSASTACPMSVTAGRRH